MRTIALALLLTAGAAMPAMAGTDGILIATRHGPVYYAPPPASYMAPHGRYVITYRYEPRRGVVYDRITGFAPSYLWPHVYRLRAYAAPRHRIHGAAVWCHRRDDLVTCGRRTKP